MNFFCFKTSRLKKRSEDLLRETNGCQRQFKKDRLLGLMNSIKFCELDEVILNFECFKSFNLILSLKFI